MVDANGVVTACVHLIVKDKDGDYLCDLMGNPEIGSFDIRPDNEDPDVPAVSIRGGGITSEDIDNLVRGLRIFQEFMFKGDPNV